jgi:hypothetical protein
LVTETFSCLLATFLICPFIVRVVPSNLRFDSAFAALAVPSEVYILLVPALAIVENPVPDEPEEPDDPDCPEEPEDPAAPEDPEEPEEPFPPAAPSKLVTHPVRLPLPSISVTLTVNAPDPIL